MSSTDLILNRIVRNNLSLNKISVSRVLIIYHEEAFFIGDSCIKMNGLKACKCLYENATIDINFTFDKYIDKYKELLKNNPYIDEVYNLSIDEIDFPTYDIVLCVDYREDMILNMIKFKYAYLFIKQDFNTAIYSLTNECLGEAPGSKTVFPENIDLFEMGKSIIHGEPRELYISDEERNWGDTWLENNGLKYDEKLFVVLDSSSEREKLLSLDVYFDLLKYLLNIPKSRVLIYDERGIGKDIFYKEWLDIRYFERLIFSKKLNLRQDICLLASRRTKLILGPCTGLMHCASGIYNFISKKDSSRLSVPFMITYTGKYYKSDQCANYWWNNSPLINCMILRKKDGRRQMLLLEDIVSDKNVYDNLLFCTDYQLSDFTDVFNAKGFDSV